MHRITAAFGVTAGASMIHKDSPDNLGTKCEKVYTVFAPNGARLNQFEISLIGQCCGLQRMAGTPTAQVSTGDSTKLRVQQRDQVVERLPIAVAPCGDQCADVLCTGSHGAKILL